MTTNRRQFLTNAVAAAAALTVASPTPGKTPRKFTRAEMDRIKERVYREADDLPDGEQHPEVHHAIVALFAVLDAADVFLADHEARSGEWRCECAYCDELRTQVYTLKLFVARLKDSTQPAGLILRRELLHEQRSKARWEAAATATPAPLGSDEEEDRSLYPVLLALYDFQNYADALLTRHQFEQGDGTLCRCTHCHELTNQARVAARCFESYWSSSLSMDADIRAIEERFESDLAARQTAVAAWKRPPGVTTHFARD